MNSAIEVHTHSCRLYQALVNTAAKATLLLSPMTRTYRLRVSIPFTYPYILDPKQKTSSTLRLLLYLYIPHGPRTMGRPTRFLLSYIILERTTFDLTHYNLCFVHCAQPLPYFYPKLWSLSPKTIM